MLLAVPNVSEGRDREVVAAVGAAFAGLHAPVDGRGADGNAAEESVAGGVRVLDVHSDVDHDRSVYTLAGRPGELADALLRGAAVAVERIDVIGDRPGGDATRGRHPYVGALDVAPVVYLDAFARGAACAEALVVADRIGSELELPVFVYGELAGDRPCSTRAELRRGGVDGLAKRMAAGDGALDGRRPDFGPPRMHPTAGATLIAARPPLVAFNVQLGGPATVQDARRIAALIRDGGAEGLPGVRAIGVELGGGVAQVSMNVERPLEIPLALVVEAVGRHAVLAGAELVGLAPRAALEGFPQDVPLPGFDAARHVIENAVGENSLGS
jgi:glutamate formiminotransferase/glutamate formiminotransferase/formiminotetrahydrofolate cyclodeaminase